MTMQPQAYTAFGRDLDEVCHIAKTMHAMLTSAAGETNGIMRHQNTRTRPKRGQQLRRALKLLRSDRSTGIPGQAITSARIDRYQMDMAGTLCKRINLIAQSGPSLPGGEVTLKKSGGLRFFGAVIMVAGTAKPGGICGSPTRSAFGRLAYFRLKPQCRSITGKDQVIGTMSQSSSMSFDSTTSACRNRRPRPRQRKLNQAARRLLNQSRFVQPRSGAVMWISLKCARRIMDPTAGCWRSSVSYNSAETIIGNGHAAIG